MSPPVLSNETPDSITVSWEPGWDGGAEITHYSLIREMNSRGVWEEEIEIGEGDGDSEVGIPREWVVGDLDAGTRYRFKVRARNCRGEREWSEPSRQLRCPTKVEFIIISQKRKQAKRKARMSGNAKK